MGQALLIYAMGHLPPLVVGLALLSQPVIATTIGWAACGERLTAIDAAGMAVIMIALVLVRRQPRGATAGRGLRPRLAAGAGRPMFAA